MHCALDQVFLMKTSPLVYEILSSHVCKLELLATGLLDMHFVRAFD